MAYPRLTRSGPLSLYAPLTYFGAHSPAGNKSGARMLTVPRLTNLRGSKPFTTCTTLNSQAQCRLPLSQVNSFDKKNVLPFHNASRLSLFLFDTSGSGSSGPVFGSLDR